MKQRLIATLVLAALPFTASAQDAAATKTTAATTVPATTTTTTTTPAATTAATTTTTTTTTAAAPAPVPAPAPTVPFDANAPSPTGAPNAAQNGGWTGSGEFGFASSRGNSRTENANAKLGLSQENELWKNNIYLNGLRSKGETSVTDADGNTIDKFSTTANRYDTGASVGYKFDPRSYIVTAARYEHDDFGANLWQGIVSVGYGYIALKNERAELSFEVGPGYKRYQPAKSTRPELNADGTPVVDPVTGDAVSVPYTPNTEGEVVARSLINGKYRLTENTALEDTLLVEAGSKNQYYQNDIGLSVSMTKKMALKLGYQIRYNSDTQPGTVSTDKLMTTNLVYNF
ncbi:putative salt-induced outer membrane protein [Luteibacter sp. HA06]|jgi:putative salt-induced outer membrane protein